jgi:hypothetical protein
MAVKQSTTKPATKAAVKAEPVAAKPQEVVETTTVVAQEVQAVGEVKPTDPKVLRQAAEQEKDPVVMQAIEEGLKGKSGITRKQNILVQGDSMILVHAFQDAVARGARLTGEFPQLNNFPKHIKLQVELDLADEEWVSDVPNGIHCSPIAAKELIFDKETMEGLPWEAFRKVCVKHGITGRDRKVMLADYLKRTA